MIGDFEILLRMCVACLLGGVIGIERQKNRHPAGFRTHILVCIGSALVMLCNQYLFEKFKLQANVDPARLGAQVISGIGFLGAGTIIKEGISVKGLTTAASLWAVACIGIATGVGFYLGAFLATSFVLITLIIFSKFEHVFMSKSGKIVIKLRITKQDRAMAEVKHLLKGFQVEVNRIFTEAITEENVLIRIMAFNHKGVSFFDISAALDDVAGVDMIEICE